MSALAMLPRAALMPITLGALSSTARCAETMEFIRLASGTGPLHLCLWHLPASGSNAGPAVLILHGATFPSGNAAAWKIEGHSWMDDLSEHGFDVYALDFLGYGESDKYPEMTAGAALGPPLGDVASMVQQVERAVTAIVARRPGAPINLVAHSAGTFAAARYAQLNPNRIASLVLFGAPTPSRIRASSEPPSTRFLQVSADDQLTAFESRVRETGRLDARMYSAWAAAYLASDPQGTTRHPQSVRVPSGMVAAVAEMDRVGELPYDPARITTPILVIQGEWDAVTSPSRGIWLLERLASRSRRLVILGRAGHRLHLEQGRSQLYEEVRAFLDATDDGATVVTDHARQE